MTRETLIEVMARAINVSAGDNSHWKFWEDEARAALLALEAAGVRMVPVEASTEMEDAGTKVIMKAWGDGNRVYATDVYELMLAASPYATQKDTTHESD